MGKWKELITRVSNYRTRLDCYSLFLAFILDYFFPRNWNLPSERQNYTIFGLHLFLISLWTLPQSLAV